jgi:hypothetical protein
MMCEHEFESLRTADGSFCMTACRLCMKSTGEIETLFKAENRIAAANARIAEMETEASLARQSFFKLSTIRIETEQRAEQAESQCAAMRMALEWYATHEVFFMQPEYDYEAKVGCSHIASAALEEKP